MYEMTLSGLLRAGASEYAQTVAGFLIIEVEGVTPAPETIVNPSRNFEAKLAYFQKAYNEDLTLKANPSIRISNYAFVQSLEEYYN